jgi:hypothetical protein
MAVHLCSQQWRGARIENIATELASTAPHELPVGTVVVLSLPRVISVIVVNDAPSSPAGFLPVLVLPSAVLHQVLAMQ